MQQLDLNVLLLTFEPLFCVCMFSVTLERNKKKEKKNFRFRLLNEKYWIEIEKRKLKHRKPAMKLFLKWAENWEDQRRFFLCLRCKIFKKVNLGWVPDWIIREVRKEYSANINYKGASVWFHPSVLPLSQSINQNFNFIIF